MWHNLAQDIADLFRLLEGHVRPGDLGIFQAHGIGQDKNKKHDWYKERMKTAKITGRYEAVKAKQNAAMKLFLARHGFATHRQYLNSLKEKRGKQSTDCT